jgi:hypothetical protein
MSVKTFFEKIGDWFKEIGHVSTWEQTALTTLKIAAPLLNTLITLTAGEPIAAKVAGIVNQVISDLGATSALLTGSQGASGVTVTSFLESVKSNLGALLADADIKNSTKAEQITGVVNTVIGEIEAISSAMPKSGGPPVAPAAA